MKKQSEAEWLERYLDYHDGRYGSDWLKNGMLARKLLAALRRRGWTPPKKKGKR